MVVSLTYSIKSRWDYCGHHKAVDKHPVDSMLSHLIYRVFGLGKIREVIMSSNIRDAALKLGYIDARPVTGQPFDTWLNRLKSIPLGEHLSFEHDPANISGWPCDEITIWVAIAPTPPVEHWPEACGEIGSFYMRSEERKKRHAAWEDAVVELGYEIKRGVMLPERAAAMRARLGVYGLNGLMIVPNYGSFVDITLLLVHAAPPPEARGAEYDLSLRCGSCGECIKACPTGAISKNGVNTLICLRHYMNRLEQMQESDYSKMGRRILGCEACQLACPYNASLEREHPPADMCEYMRIENLLTNPDISGISKYIKLNETKVRTQAVLAAANMDRKDLLHLIETLIGNEDKMLDKIARWAAEGCLSSP